MAPLQGDPVVSSYRVSNREMAATFDSDPCVDRTAGGARGLILNLRYTKTPTFAAGFVSILKYSSIWEMR